MPDADSSGNPSRASKHVGVISLRGQGRLGVVSGADEEGDMKATLVGALRAEDFQYDLAVVERAGGEVVELEGEIDERPGRRGQFHAQARVGAKLGVKVDEPVVRVKALGLRVIRGGLGRSEPRKRAGSAGRGVAAARGQ